MTCILKILFSAALISCPAYSQAPAFEVADIKLADSNANSPGKGRVLPGGRIEASAMSVQDLVMFAYGVRENMIAGLPKWTNNARFDIVAKAPPDTPPTSLRLMLQNLLAERFQLAFHREERAAPAYALTVGKDGPKFQASSTGKRLCDWIILEAGLRRRDCHNVTMAELATDLPLLGGVGIDLPVVDKTGLQGAWDFHFDVGFAAPLKAPEHPGEPGPQDIGPSIFKALEQIGLKLEGHKVPLPMIVVDRIEPPTVN